VALLPLQDIKQGFLKILSDYGRSQQKQMKEVASMDFDDFFDDLSTEDFAILVDIGIMKKTQERKRIERDQNK